MAVEIVYETRATTTENEAGIAPAGSPADSRKWASARPANWANADLATASRPCSSPTCNRAVQTARIAFPDGRLPIHQDIRLRECDYGDLS
ncbi:histidine phosphatase family protein [Streptomyces sp. NPDC056192]|uniref:histidine phosphatase family protein n=1 Tax=unclassified Streptomyces TaxID=2593676 RepID=UPI0035D984D7